jgi:vacuole morphology and inheritance protein 14
MHCNVSYRFDIETFIPLLQKHIKRTKVRIGRCAYSASSLHLKVDYVFLIKPYIRQLLVSWITVLDAVPDINMLDYLPDFLDGLFNMLSDGNREIKQSADNALTEFLREIKEAEVVEFGPMVNILVAQCHSKEKSNRLTAISWITEFISLGGTRLLLFYASILSSVMHCISDAETDIRQAAKVANQDLLHLVKNTTDPFELNPLLHTLTLELLSEHVGTRVAALQWINMLHEKDPSDMNKSIGDLLPALLKTISDSADEVVLINLQVLARISLDEIQFQRVLNALIHLFMDDRSLLETRGALVIRKLCALLNCRNIYICKLNHVFAYVVDVPLPTVWISLLQRTLHFAALAAILNEKPDLEFVSLMVQTLNLILLTAPELSPLRKALKSVSLPSSASTDKDMFVSLFKCWTHNPVATFSLCLLSQAYDLSACLIHKFAEVDVSVGFLMQIDKLVQLLESPIFIHLRLQLLEVNTKHQADLLKSLYGLLMLLPQSQAYKTLSDRLTTVSSLHMHIGNMRGLQDYGKKVDGGSSGSKPTVRQFDELVNFGDLLARFESIQERHSTFRLGLLQQKSLLRADTM